MGHLIAISNYGRVPGLVGHAWYKRTLLHTMYIGTNMYKLYVLCACHIDCHMLKAQHHSFAMFCIALMLDLLQYIYVPGSGSPPPLHPWSWHPPSPPCKCGLRWEVVVYAMCSWYPHSRCRVGWSVKRVAYAVWRIQ